MPRRVDVFFHNPDPSRASCLHPSLPLPPPPRHRSPTPASSITINSPRFLSFLSHPPPAQVIWMSLSLRFPSCGLAFSAPTCTDLHVLKHPHPVGLYPYNFTSGGVSSGTSFPGYMIPIKNGLYPKRVTKGDLGVFNWSRRNCQRRDCIFVEEWVGCL